MKKTKIAAIVACAALLVLGMAFTAMAANKWVFQNGGWYAVDKDGEPVEYVWVKGEDGVEYWAGEDGLWVTESWVDDEDPTDAVYVGADGKRATGWQYIANSEDDVEDYGDYSWYFLTGKGKKTFSAGKSKDVEGNGNRYCFDATGRMVTGWVAAAGDGSFEEIDPDPEEDGIATAMYYCGAENEGWVAKDWVYLWAPTDTDDETESYWFFFNRTTGQITKDGTEPYSKKIDGINYKFDEAGRMLDGFVVEGSPATAGIAYLYASGKTMSKDWVWTAPSSGIVTAAGIDEDDKDTPHWFWADKNGNVAYSCFTTAKTKKTYWALDESGIMISGLYVIPMDVASVTTAKPTAAIATGDIPAFDDGVTDSAQIKSGTSNFQKALTGNKYFYFGDEYTDGSMKVGSQTFAIDGENVTMRFSKGAKDYFYVASTSNGMDKVAWTEGMSVYGVQGNKLYAAGQVICGNEDNYVSISVLKATSSDGKAALPTTKLDDGAEVLDEVAFDIAKGNARTKAELTSRTEYTNFAENYCVVKADGTIVKKANGIKDSDGNKYYISDYKLTKIVIPE